MNKESGEPYAAFGAKIKYFREQWQQSIGEVSVTLEIDQDILEQIESGKFMPSEELVNLLISHFLLTEDQADELRSLAFSQSEQNPEALLGGLEDMLMKQIVMYMPVDNRIVYTDSMNATVNKHGVVLQFMQGSNKDGKPSVVSQVGMSREHAEKMIEVIKSTLEHHDKPKQTKLLPSPKKDK